METDLKLILPALGLNPLEYQEKVIVVTGAGGGIGLQTARAFTLLRAKVVIAEQREDTGKAAAEILQAEGGTALFVQTDVSDSASVAHLVQETHARFGLVNILVNKIGRAHV